MDKETISIIGIIMTIGIALTAFIVTIIWFATDADIKTREADFKHKELCLENGTGFYYDNYNKIVCK